MSRRIPTDSGENACEASEGGEGGEELKENRASRTQRTVGQEVDGPIGTRAYPSH